MKEFCVSIGCLIPFNYDVVVKAENDLDAYNKALDSYYYNTPNGEYDEGDFEDSRLMDEPEDNPPTHIPESVHIEKL